MTLPESVIAVNRPLCPLCRGDGYIICGAVFARCPECKRRDWEGFSRRLKDLPPCFGYASCSERTMLLCSWAEGCREGDP